MDLREFYKLQNELDKFIVENSINKDIDHNGKIFLSDRLLALMTEVAEFANATKCFKYWSKKPAEPKERLLDEYVDILHFWLSIGNIMQFTSEEVTEAYMKKWRENKARQMQGY